jgi:hypothetical protein
LALPIPRPHNSIRRRSSSNPPQSPHAFPTPRALPAADLARRRGRPVNGSADANEAIDPALQMATTVCGAGSIFLAGAVRDGLKQRANLP